MSGFEVLNTFNTIQVTNAERPMTLRKSGWLVDADFVLSLGVAGRREGTMPMDLSYMNCPLVFFRSNGAQSRITPLMPSGSNFSAPLKHLQFIKWWNIPLQNPVAYYIFDDWLPPERTNAGIQLFRETSLNDIVFDSS